MADTNPEHYKGQFGSMKFPPYKFREFPKILYGEDGKTLGIVNNLREEQELYASVGIEKADVDPLGALTDENAELKARLAKYEGSAEQANVPIKIAGVRSETVQMLPEEVPAVKVEPQASGVPLKAPNPLLKPAPVAGSPQPIGSAPKVDKPLSPGV